ncbi:MAG: tetratricopeptide repeat protein [Acidobacteria bacterium]|nr:tetratricopeptide repeat protein [Acidobacteriota bacterium]
MIAFRTVKFILVFIISLSPSLSSWAQSPTADAAEEISRGISLYKSGDNRGAAEVLSAAARKQKDNADAWYYLALAQMRSGDTKSSRKSFENAIKLRPEHAASHSGLAYLLLILNDLRNAEKEAETAVTLNSQDADAHFVLAKVYSLERRWEAAQKESEAALKILPGNAAALLLKVQALVGQTAPVWNQLGKKGDGKKETQDQNSPEISRERRLKLEQAQEALGNYLSLRPNDSEAVWWREQLEAMKAHAKQLKDKEEGNWNYEMLKDGVTSPTILEKVKAKYTDEARDRGITGYIRLRVIFAVDGSLKDILVIEGLDAGLSWTAIEAARKIRFKPATKGDQPVQVVGYLEYYFSL